MLCCVTKPPRPQNSCKRAQEGSKRGPRELQDGPKSAQERSKTASRRPKRRFEALSRGSGNPTSPLGGGGLTSFLFHPSLFPFGE
eukprot:829853-Pyramimonas_sp.AAC.1